MGHAYKAVGWSRQKKLYDATLALGLALFLATFVGTSAYLEPHATLETLLIRGFGVTAFALLHLILAIGPLCRLDARFLPLLHNRRHMGVTMFVLALAHGTFAFVQYHALGVLNPFVSLFVSDAGAVPFQTFGVVALAILFLMAATSHDFWLANLSAPVWKALHMLVYVAYALLVAHVAFGVLQSERSSAITAIVALAMLGVLALHTLAARKERRIDHERRAALDDGYVDVCGVDEIREKRARIACVAGDRIALFKYDGKLSAVSNACQHQNGPLGEGRVVDGCIVCPWHGYQYAPDSGSSPAPFTEKVPTFRVKVIAGRALVHATPLPAGTRVEPARIEGAIGDEAATDGEPGEFFIGWQARMQPLLARFTRGVAVRVIAASLVVAVVLAASQRGLRATRFEYGEAREFRGVIETVPYPMLRVARPGDPERASRYLLVAPGKHGALDATLAFDNQGVRLRGQLVYHDDETLIEVAADSIELDASVAVPPRAALESLGRFAFVGEIVDSKCHLGVMNPGERATHRACAKLCIRGGIPPLLWVEDELGRAQKLLLVDELGAAVNERVLELVGERVRIEGEVVRHDDWLVLRADPATYALVR